jgi:hypothetical protein
MKKMNYFKVLLFLVTVTMISCVEDSTGGVSSVTSYPEISVQGDATVFIEQGSTYEDAGAISMAGDAVLETTITYGTGAYTESPFGTEVADKYTITYSALNEDGFAGNALRDVWVVPPTSDMVTSIEGLYTAATQRAPDFVPSDQYDGLTYVTISKTGDSTYALSHAIGGYYDMGRGYGSGYAALGAVITANDIATNDFTATQAVFPIWGNTVDITEFTVDAASKSITFTGDGNFGNGTFKVQLTQVQP